MVSVERVHAKLRSSQTNVSYADLDNIQNDHGKAKAYQVRQVLKAIAKLKGDDDQ